MRNLIRRIDLLATLCAFLLLLSPDSAVLAQTADESARTGHFFPLIADGDGFQSRLFVTNASDASNLCTLSLRGPGLDESVFQPNDALRPFGAVSVIELAEAGDSTTLTSAGGQDLAFGYAKLECAEPAVARVLLSLENGGTPLSLATLESTTPGMSFQFPVLPRLGRLALVFSSEARLATACAVELEDEAGASLGSGDISVPAESTALQFLDELIPVPDGFRAGKARISCNQDVAAVGIPLNGPVFTALSATMLGDDTAGVSHILPLIQDGGGFRSRLLLTSLAETANRCAVDLYGRGLEASRFEIPAGAAASGSNISLAFAGKGDQASLLSTGTGDLAYGYAAVECDGPVAARNLLTVDVAGGLAGMAAVSSARPADGMEFPVVPELGRLTLAMNNEGESEASCAIELTVSGDTVSSTGLFQVPGQSTLLRFLGDLFALRDDFSGGMAKLSCYSEVSAYSLLVSDPIFAAMPAAVVPIRINPESARTIPDENLRLLIFRQLGKAPGALVGPEELSELRTLDARNAGIESLEGLQYATGLTSLDFGPAPWDPENGRVNSNRVTDLSPIFGLSNLQTLNLAHTGLSGPIPGELGQLSHLQTLDLASNELSGPIPPELGQLSNLEYLNLSSNDLSGLIPMELGQLPNLGYLYLWNNELSGPIPPELGQLGNLRYLYLGRNQLVGSIPEELGRLSNLQSLNLANNELSGPIPSEIGQLGNLRYLLLGWNQLTGTIPAELGQLSNLEYLDLSYNDFKDISQLAGDNELGDGVTIDVTQNPLNHESLNVHIPTLKSKGVVVLASEELFRSGEFTDSTGRTIQYRLHFRHDWDLSEPRGLLIYFHGNNTGTEQDMLRWTLSREDALDRGLFYAVVASPQSSWPGSGGEEGWIFGNRIKSGGTRFWEYSRDSRLVHELLQNDFNGTVNVDHDRIVFQGGSQGTSFLNQFLARYAHVYGGGFYAWCGRIWPELRPPRMETPWMPTVPWSNHMSNQVAQRLRVFVEATTGDHVYDDSVRARDYYRDDLGLETRWDLDSPGGHCATGATPRESVFDWLTGINPIPLSFGEVSDDHDGDGLKDAQDPDDDNDGALDIIDALPLEPREWLDTDADGIGNFLDRDADGDGVENVLDAFPLDSAEWNDTDSDGIGDNLDADDDNDNLPDADDPNRLKGLRNDQLSQRVVYEGPGHNTGLAKLKAAGSHDVRPSGIMYPAASGGIQSYFFVSLGDSADPIFEVMIDSHEFKEPCGDVLIQTFCDRSAGMYFFEEWLHKVFIDRNQNRDLTDDGPPVVIARSAADYAGRIGTSTVVNVAYSTGDVLPYTLGVYPYHSEATDLVLHVKGWSTWVGPVSVSGSEPVLVGTIDFDNNGVFGTATEFADETIQSGDFSCVDTNRDGWLGECVVWNPIQSISTYPFSPFSTDKPFELDGRSCMIEVEPTGHRVRIDCL